MQSPPGSTRHQGSNERSSEEWILWKTNQEKVRGNSLKLEKRRGKRVNALTIRAKKPKNQESTTEERMATTRSSAQLEWKSPSRNPRPRHIHPTHQATQEHRNRSNLDTITTTAEQVHFPHRRKEETTPRKKKKSVQDHTKKTAASTQEAQRRKINSYTFVSDKITKEQLFFLEFSEHKRETRHRKRYLEKRNFFLWILTFEKERNYTEPMGQPPSEIKDE
ncbi:hypothetical protein BJ508DRAFT_315548 [Ascobolus immersus RN42]|uniref:Uncharacterized protein n=1 Tax=Ascobolus immersus RN42 TaxID=1160509 RepID=A0A3N4HCX4_ASCIM|nr:hypothetical protein BJ508DRAFT_315548 [Ascobolus immersus RN42]